MNKTKILGIGVGRAGNVLLNTFLHKDSRLTGLFINSCIEDLVDIDLFDRNKNGFLFSTLTGSGREREKAKTFLKDDVDSFADTILKYPLKTDVIIFFSLDGGTGGGTVPKLIEVIRKVCPTKSINIVGVLPDFNKADKVAIENTVACWDELNALGLKSYTWTDDNGKGHTIPIINNSLFIDNSKRSSFRAINNKAISDLYDALCMNGKCEDGSIDDSDARKAFTAYGYGVILSLNSADNIEHSISKAKKDTVYDLPDDFVCNYIAVSTKSYNPSKIVDEFDYEETKYVAKNDIHDTIILGGCNQPQYCIDALKLVYKDLMSKNNRRSGIQRGEVKAPKTTSKTTIKEDVKASFTSNELKNLFSDIF